MAADATRFTRSSAWAGARYSEFIMHCETRMVVVTFTAFTHSRPFRPIATSYCTAAPRAARTGVVGVPSSFRARAVEQSTRYPLFRWPKPAACRVWHCLKCAEQIFRGCRTNL